MTDEKRGLSIVIPVYRGANTVGILVRALSQLHPEGGLEIILVNDGSPDNSDEVCAELLAEATVPMLYIEHGRNFGEHNAVMTGLRYASGAYVVTMDDDLQNPADAATKLYDHARLNGFDVVYSRYAVTKQVLWRRLGSQFANKVADWLLDKPPGLYLSSFRCMSAFVVQGVTRYAGPYPYIDGLIMQTTQRIGTIEVQHFPRADGESGYTTRRLIRLWLNLATSFSLAPLRVAIWAGLVMAIIGSIGAVEVIIEALTSRSLPSGWASTMTALLLVSGTQSMILGILGEYVGRTFLSTSAKPQATIRRAVRSQAEPAAPAIAE
jgi:undecaprenyl-phosphate 4-deoxy-4-formamido-L-arabinose transferase